MQKILFNKLVDFKDLNSEEMESLLDSILKSELTACQIGGLLTALRMKGESVIELTASAKILRRYMTPVESAIAPLMDVVGTGGDQQHSFNISTVTAFVLCAAGGKVAKHGGRSVSSCSGSADVLTAAGANINLTVPQIARCIEEIGIGFMFAPNHHPLMQSVQTMRRELGIRTLFNLLGPLTNPARATHHLIGVFDARWLEPFAHVLLNLGSTRALIVHSKDGLDEISIDAPTKIAELKAGKITTSEIKPEDFGFQRQSLKNLTVKDAATSLALITRVLNNENCTALDIVLLNAGAAIYVAGLAANIDAGVRLAREAVASGRARDKFNRYIEFTRHY